MARRTVRRSFRRSDLWPTVMIVAAVACAAPLFVQATGWWAATTAQREAASALMTGMSMALIAVDTLRGQRRRVVSRRRLPDVVIVLIVLATVLGCSAAAMGLAMLLGVLSALPINALILPMGLLICDIPVLCARVWAGPERLVL